MKKHFLNIIFLIFILLIVCSLVKQKDEELIVENKPKPIEEVNYIPYYLKVYEADSLYLIGDYQRSYEILDSLFEKYEPLNQDIYNEITTFINSSYKTKNYNKLKGTIKILIENYGGKYSQLDEGIKTLNLFSNPEINEMELLYNSKINRVLRDSIINMNKIDQFYHGNKDHLDSTRYINEIHYKVICNFIDTYNFSKRTIGNRTKNENSSIGVLLIHLARVDSTNFLKEKVYDQMLLGNLTPYEYASMMDRDLLNKDLPQKYYTFNSDKIITDSQLVNKERKKIGLPSLQYPEWRFNEFLKQLN